MQDDTDRFHAERAARIAANATREPLQSSARRFLLDSLDAQYSYNFSWMGLPIIQYPQDLLALQEIIWETRPDCIVETGVARGGSLLFFASMLELLGGNGVVVGVDVDIRAHNRRRILASPLAHRIRLVEGSSIDDATIAAVRAHLEGRSRVMVSLDSNHSHEHVLGELRCYGPLVTPGCYCVVFDTVVETMQPGSFSNRSWDVGNNPMTAVRAYLAEDANFEVDRAVEDKLLVTVAPGGWLRRKQA